MADVFRERLREDARRLRRYLRSKYGYVPLTWFLEPAWLCVLLYRMSHRSWSRGSANGARFWMQLNSLVTGADIQPASDLGPGLLIPNPAGVTISGKAGPSLTVLALSGLGGNVPTKDVGAGPGLPLLGAGIHVGQFTGIQGAIVIGDGVLFHAGTGVVVHVPAGARMMPAFAPQVSATPVEQVPHPRPLPCGHASWRITAQHWREDIARTSREMLRLAPAGQRTPKALSVVLTNPLLALAVYRVSHWLHCNGWRRLARLLGGFNVLMHKSTIPPHTCLGGGVLIPHLSGLLIHGRAGANLAVFANAVCSCSGAATEQAAALAPTLGHDVMVGGHSGVFGPIRLGDRIQIGPKGQVVEDVASDMQVWDPQSRGTTEAAAFPSLDADASLPVRPAAERPWRQAWRCMREDRVRWRVTGAAAFPGLVCTDLFRLSHAFHRSGWRRLARWCALANIYLTGADITPVCEIGGGLLVPHPAGIGIHGRAGQDLTVMATAGIGALLHNGEIAPLDAAPQLGDRVHLAHHCGVFGPVSVGSDVRTAPGCILNRSVPDGAALVPRPVRLRERRSFERPAQPAPRHCEPAQPGG